MLKVICNTYRHWNKAGHTQCFSVFYCTTLGRHPILSVGDCTQSNAQRLANHAIGSNSCEDVLSFENNMSSARDYKDAMKIFKPSYVRDDEAIAIIKAAF